MASVLELVAEKTQGRRYQSYRYCIDEEISLPRIAYDEERANFTVYKDRYGENGNRQIRNLSSLAVQLQEVASPLFRYFLDGSRRIYKIDDIAYNRRLYPIVGGQIGIACCERIHAGQFRAAQVESHLVLALPTVANPDGGDTPHFFNNLVSKINDTPRMKRFNMRLSKIVSYASNKTEGKDYKPEDLGVASIQEEMIECEKKVVIDLTNRHLLSQDQYLIKDGSLQYGKPLRKGDHKELAKIKNNYRWVVGVSKSFDPQLVKDRTGKSQATIIANLKCYERTPAYMYQTDMVGDVPFSIWYVRIREARYTESPFAGVLKLEKILITNQEIENGLDSEEVDLITANIINERQPVCYGRDQRWANHLYPVYLTETFIKSRYLSDVHYMSLF